MTKTIYLIIAKIMFKFMKRAASNKDFYTYCESEGFHITPAYFYSPIPDSFELTDEILGSRTELKGIRMNIEQQISLLESFTQNYRSEYSLLPMQPTGIPHRYYLTSGAFNSVDGEMLYCMIRHFRPKRVYEIGSGHTTFLSAETLLKNAGEDVATPVLHAFEPYPGEILKKGFPGLTRLIPDKVQNVPLRVFEELEENDILFIDSTHVLKTGSDVHYEYLEILPRLKKGVIVHIHDIFLPAEYPRNWLLNNHWFWNEQYLLQAFLQFNDNFEVLWAGSCMHLNHPEKLEAAFPSYDRETVHPGSFWMRRIR